MLLPTSEGEDGLAAEGTPRSACLLVHGEAPGDGAGDAGGGGGGGEWDDSDYGGDGRGDV